MGVLMDLGRSVLCPRSTCNHSSRLPRKDTMGATTGTRAFSVKGVNLFRIRFSSCTGTSLIQFVTLRLNISLHSEYAGSKRLRS